VDADGLPRNRARREEECLCLGDQHERFGVLLFERVPEFEGSAGPARIEQDDLPRDEMRGH